ncbi:MAG TPA: response regulator [Woeseiaceae bacterium]|nr:response regulator [Woeseiaceae bacterium]
MGESQAAVLVIEDEAHIRSFLRISLEAHGYSVVEARTGEDGLSLAGQNPPQLVIVDLGLPDMDGQEVIERLREWSEVPILVLSVRGDEKEKVRALDSGANDYVTKPAAISELMARVRVLLRKREPDEAEGALYERNGLRIDLSRREVHKDGVAVHVTRKEYQLLRLLVRSAGRVLTHQCLLREVWGPGFTTETHYLRVLVSGLRQKLGDDPADPHYIVTEQGVGYRLLD